ncbi:TIR domain-containing protein [Streptomyces sp. NPDC008222]
MGSVEVPGGAWFVSHAGADRAWAEWAAWQLVDAGFQVEAGGAGADRGGPHPG